MEIPIQIRRDSNALESYLYVRIRDEKERRQVFREQHVKDFFSGSPHGCAGAGRLDDCRSCKLPPRILEKEMSFRVTRYHDISCGHRVHGHESKCAFLHGHNYRIHFECMASEDSVAALDKIGRVIDFSVIKSRICEWLEKNWDHKFLAWKLDPVMMELYYGKDGKQPHSLIQQSIVWVPFNPTAENMAKYLVENVGRITLEGTGAQLVKVTIDETRKCSASYEPVFYAKDVRADNVYSND